MELTVDNDRSCAATTSGTVLVGCASTVAYEGVVNDEKGLRFGGAVGGADVAVNGGAVASADGNTVAPLLVLDELELELLIPWGTGPPIGIVG